MTKSMSFTINLTNIPKDNKYSPFDPIVKGNLSVKFEKQVQKIYSITYGLIGTVFATTREDRILGQDLLFTSSSNFYKDSRNIILDEQHRNLFNHKGLKLFTYGPNAKLETDFEFEFPDDVYLPSSCTGLCEFDGSLGIYYAINVTVFKYKGFLTKKPQIYLSSSTPIIYQSGILKSNPTKPMINFFNSVIFKNKVKKFYFDGNHNALIPCPLDRSHSRSKFMRKIWDSNYRTVNYNIMTKSIPLCLYMGLNSYFNLTQPIIDQFSVKLVSDLKSVGIDSNRSTDFVFNGQSTNLGVFHINSLSVRLLYEIDIKCFLAEVVLYCRQYMFKVKFNKLIVDVKDFKYDATENIYKCEITPDELQEVADMDLGKCLMDILGQKTVISTGSINNLFENKSRFEYIWEVTDGMHDKKLIVFHSKVIPEFLMDPCKDGKKAKNYCSSIPSYFDDKNVEIEFEHEEVSSKE